MTVPGLDADVWPEDIPTLIDTFSYATRFMPHFVKPTDKYKPLLQDDDSDFNTQGYNPYEGTPIEDTNIEKGGHFIVFNDRDNDIPIELQKEILTYSNKVYDRYKIMEKASPLSTIEPVPSYSVTENNKDHYYIPIFLTKSSAATTGKTTNLPFSTGASHLFYYLEKISTGYDYPSISEVIAHEIWHLFQFATTDGAFGSAAIFLKNKTWLYEGSAEYMGARTFIDMPMRAFDFTNNGPPHYLEEVNQNQDTMNRALEERTDHTTGGTAGYSTAALFTYLADETAQQGGVDVMMDLLKEMWANPFENAYTIIQNATSSSFEDIYAQFAEACAKNQMYERIHPTFHVNGVSTIILSNASSLRLGMDNTFDNPISIEIPFTQRWATNYIMAAPENNVGENQALYLKVLKDSSIPLRIQVFPYKDQQINNRLERTFLPSKTIPFSESSDYHQVVDDFKDISGAYISISNVSENSINTQSWSTVTLKAALGEPEADSANWIAINPNTNFDVRVNNPQLSPCSSDESSYQTLNFRYINPITHQPATPQPPLKITYNTILGTQTYPVELFSPMITAPDFYAVYVKTCKYSDSVNMWNYEAIHGVHPIPGSVFLEDSLGRKSNIIYNTWFLN